MAPSDRGSLTKEPPLGKLDETIRAIRPGMPYAALIDFSRKNTFDVIPGLLRKRFIDVDEADVIVYDRFLQLLNEHDLESPFMRKIMYFVWAYRDDRIRRFICERVADARGKWRLRELLNKANSAFFEEWLVPGSSRKARSNIEFFLETAGIFNRNARTIHLELDDSWLAEAAAVAAQYETDITARRKLVNDPLGFLIQERLTGLINATIDELRSVHLPPTDDPAPSGDDEISLSPANRGSSRDWSDKAFRGSGRKSTTAQIDLVARERANKAHRQLEKMLAEAAIRQKYRPKQNNNIDLYFDTPHGKCLAEIKSANGKNFHSQIRKGVSQLFEYRYVYRDQVGAQPTLLLVMETIPRRSKHWLIDYLESIGIVVAWKDPESDRIISSCSIPTSLRGVVHSKG